MPHAPLLTALLAFSKSPRRYMRPQPRHVRPPWLFTSKWSFSCCDAPFPIVMSSHGLDAEFEEEEAICFSPTQPPQSPVYDDYIVWYYEYINQIALYREIWG